MSDGSTSGQEERTGAERERESEKVGGDSFFFSSFCSASLKKVELFYLLTSKAVKDPYRASECSAWSAPARCLAKRMLQMATSYHFARI